ncbi:hypothetical protein BDW71DRAFT_169724 [Aspergillus fruticulosus]
MGSTAAIGYRDESRERISSPQSSYIYLISVDRSARFFVIAMAGSQLPIVRGGDAMSSDDLGLVQTWGKGSTIGNSRGESCRE